MVVNCEWEDSSFHPSVFAFANTGGMEKKRAPPIPVTDHCRENMWNAVLEVGTCSSGDSPAGRVRQETDVAQWYKSPLLVGWEVLASLVVKIWNMR